MRVVLVWALGCGDKDDAVDSGPEPTDEPSETGRESGDTTVAPLAECSPVGLAVTAPDPSAPLAYRIAATTQVASSLAVSWTDGDHAVEVVFPTATTDHAHTLLGFRPGRSYALTATFSSEGCVEIGALDVVVEPLPTWFPTVELVVPASGASPGETLAAMRTPAKVEPAEVSAVIDADGEVVWYKDVVGFNQDALERETGNLLTLAGVGKGTLLEEWAWSGERLASWGTQGGAVDVVVPSLGDYFHHDVAIVHGATDFVGLTRYGLPVTDWPVDYDDPDIVADATIADDVMLWFSESGAVLGEVALSTVLPVDRIGYDSLEVVQPDGWADWAHANAIEMDVDGKLIVSLRHLDCVIKLDPVTGQLDWILGNHDNWDPAWQPYLLQPEGADFRWAYHQHAVGRVRTALTSTYTMFDNANYQASPHTGQPIAENPVSRVVQFTVDPVAMTVTQDWSFEETSVGRLFSYAVGEADTLDNGNVLATFGILTGDEDGTNEEAGRGENSARLVEFDPISGAEAWHVHISTTASENPDGWSVYRSHRIAPVTGRVVD